MKNSRVLILGYGEMGHAMESLLQGRHRTTVWQRHGGAALADQTQDQDFILYCLPAAAHASISAQLAPHLPTQALCLTIAKGLDDSGLLPAEAMIPALGNRRVAVLYGPMIAEELRAGRPGFAECVAATPGDNARITGLYRGSTLRVEPASDLTGLSWSAVLKNVYAMAFGIADELGLGDNVRGFLAVAALRELARIVQDLGGAADTPYRIAGLGDLITTATSAGSHHHELGRKLARGEHNLKGEGVHTLQVLRVHPRFDTGAFPLFRLIDECVHEPQDIRLLFTTLLRSGL
jgi:glycerol-3-phosphate dehydrogenase (NAD(P)+)